ncbi:HAD-like domain-containing protein [Suillus lakei]|nr:HAD-like domain-containing protein [Suillus lakei]
MALPEEIVAVDAILFDLDGTLIDSTPGVISAWKTFAEEYKLGSHLPIVQKTHGRRLADTLKDETICNIQDKDLLDSEILRFEDLVIQGNPVALEGAIEFLAQLDSHHDMRTRWTIVTSASRYYAAQCIPKCKIPVPTSGFVTADDVSEGKPKPTPYLEGAKKLGIDVTKCLVIEDAPSGMQAGNSAGAKTLAVCTSHKREDFENCSEEIKRPTYIVDDLTRVRVNWENGKIQLTIDTRRGPGESAIL